MKKTLIALMALASVSMAAQDYPAEYDASSPTSYQFYFEIESTDPIADGRVLTLQYFTFSGSNLYTDGMKFNVTGENSAITLTLGAGAIAEAWDGSKAVIKSNTTFTPDRASDRSATFMGTDGNALVIDKDVVYRVTALKSNNLQSVVLARWDETSEDYIDVSSVTFNGNLNGSGGGANALSTLLNSDYAVASPPQPSPVPEPATGTLSLLALAGLCVRRRRK